MAGAAIGLGRAFCDHLSEKGINLVMVDHQEGPLQNLAGELRESRGIKTLPLTLDLRHEQSVQKILEKTADLDCRLILYNAAFSRITSFTDYSPDELNTLMDVNIRSTLHLVHGFTNRWISNHETGGILLMSSLAGLIGMNLIAPYGASKAFAWNLSESLYHELKTHKIDITTCIAGAVSTEAFLKSDPKYGFFKPQVQSPEEVVRIALKKLGKGPWFISGARNRFSYFFLTRLVPRKWASSLVNKAMRRIYSDR